MWSQQDVIHFQEGALERKWFMLEDVQGGSREALDLQRFDRGCGGAGRDAEINVVPTAASAAASAAAPQVQLGALSVTPTAAAAAAFGRDPGVVFGPTTIVAIPAAAAAFGRDIPTAPVIDVRVERSLGMGSRPLRQRVSKEDPP